MMSDDEIIVKDTQQDSISPKTFSKKIVNRFGIKSQTRRIETIDSLSQTQSRRIGGVDNIINKTKRKCKRLARVS